MEELIKRVKEHEGFRATPYKCSAGKWTVGYGLNLESATSNEILMVCGTNFTLNKEKGNLEVDIEVSEFLAESMLKQRLLDIKITLVDKLPFFTKLNEARQGVLIEMAYQLGMDGLFKFKKTLKAIQYGEWENASNEMLESKWAKKDTPARAEKLAGIMRNGNDT